VASLSECLVLINSQKDGKILQLVAEFLNLGKEIYCFPGNGDKLDGNSELIKQGANLITNIKEVKKQI
jgi:DNA processing protein